MPTTSSTIRIQSSVAPVLRAPAPTPHSRSAAPFSLATLPPSPELVSFSLSCALSSDTERFPTAADFFNPGLARVWGGPGTRQNEILKARNVAGGLFA